MMMYEIYNFVENDMHGNKANISGYVRKLSGIENHMLVQIFA
jgi:hypothetical protein